MRTLALLLCAPLLLSSQSMEDRLAPLGQFLHLQLASSPFPHPARDSGHVYGGRHFPAELHYRDSTVGVFIPKGFRSDRPLDIAVHIHGWGNNVDSVFAQFGIAEQLVGSGKNAILVVPQGPKNSSDSFGGKLEDPGRFKAFIQELADTLKRRGITRRSNVKSVILSGHSGAYRMISFILMRGGLTEKIKEVYLFDALYGQLEKFGHWLTHSSGRFVAIYCDSGGTRSTTESLMEDLSAWGIPFSAWEETDPSIDLTKQRVTFIHTDLGHNAVIAARNQYQQYLETSGLGARKKPSR